MAKSIAILSYEFLFDPSDTWAHLSQFEGDFGHFLKEHGMEGQILDSINAKDGRRILYIRKIKEIGVMGKDTPKKSVAPQDVIKKYLDDKTYRGKK